MDDATFEAILADVTAGKPVRAAIREHKARNDDFYALLVDADHWERYARAKDAGLEAWSDESIDLADQEPPKVATQFGEHIDQGYVAWKKQQIETRKWHLEKLRPKRYGARMLVGSDPDNPIPPLVVIGAKRGDGGDGESET